MRVNLGCGQAYMDGWVNVDASPDVKADIYMDAADFIREYGPEISEIYMGHVLEHIMPGDALVTLRLMNERLPAGAVVSAVTPDMTAIFEAYLAGEVSNDDLNARFVYSYVQPSHHIWCHDQQSLIDLFRRAGFRDVEPIDPLTWPPVFHKEGQEARWQSGVRAPAAGEPVPVPEELRLAAEEVSALVAEEPPPSGAVAPPTVEEVLLARSERLRARLVEEMQRRKALERAHAEGSAPGDPGVDVVAATRPKVAPIEPVTPPVGPSVPAPDLQGRARLRARARSTAAARLPKGTKRRAAARAALYTYREGLEFGQRVRTLWAQSGAVEPGAPSYVRWMRDHEATPANLEAQRRISAAAVRPARFQVLVLGTAGDADAVRESLTSLEAQSWEHWRATVLGSGSLPIAAHPKVQQWTVESDWAEAANGVVARDEDSDFVLVLVAGDQLAPECLYHVAAFDLQDPLLDLVYWDDDVLADGKRGNPRFRPSWSPELLVGADYIGRSFAIRRSRYLFASGLRPGLGHAATWDLVLRSGLDAERATRIPRLLGHVVSRQDRPGEQGRQVVQEHLERVGWPAEAVAAGDAVHVRWQLPDPAPKVSVVICTRHNRTMLRTCLPSLARTDWPDFEVVIVDNGGRSAENEQWYADNGHGLNLRVEWWDKPFNYSAVNNRGAALAGGDVLVFLNDDTEAVDPDWLRELVGWATRPEIGVAGLQLIGPSGELQHAGAVLGLGGFADHVFEGMRPGSDSLLGPTDWYRNVLAVTGACLAVRREVFSAVGGFDERFLLCGSDVAIGLDTHLLGLRNVCSPFARVRHLESATRGSHVPEEDFFASYWRYQSWVIGGDPYFHPALSLGSREPKLKSQFEPTPAQRLSEPLGRNLQVFRQRSSEAESRLLADMCRADRSVVDGVRLLHAQSAGRQEVRTVNWFIPDIDSPFYGGINTALRMADYLARQHGVENRFIVWGSGPEQFVRSALAAAFPALADAPMHFYDGDLVTSLDGIPECDVAIATLWVTAYAVAHVQGARRKFYLIQDFEPMFYPASTLYALTEESYLFGLYGLCNTENLLRIYREEYAGVGRSFMPAVDGSVFHAEGRVERTDDAPVTIFVYARPGHWRNCWELASLALEEVKRRLGRKVRIVTAGAWATAEHDSGVMKHLGLLDYRATGELYRRCDVGLALTVSKHPSYLPLELMACGVPVVAFDNPWGHWILKDGENSLLAQRTVDSLADALERLVVDGELRRRMSVNALETIAHGHADWETAFAGVYDALCDPEG